MTDQTEAENSTLLPLRVPDRAEFWLVEWYNSRLHRWLLDSTKNPTIETANNQAVLRQQLVGVTAVHLIHVPALKI